MITLLHTARVVTYQRVKINSISATRACARRNTLKEIRYERKTLRVRFNRRFVEYR